MKQKNNWFRHIAGNATPYELAVLLALESAEEWRCLLSVSQLADLAGMSRRKALYVIADLEAKGWIKRDSGKHVSPSAVNEYTITVGLSS